MGGALVTSRALRMTPEQYKKLVGSAAPRKEEDRSVARGTAVDSGPAAARERYCAHKNTAVVFTGCLCGCGMLRCGACVVEHRKALGVEVPA